MSELTIEKTVRDKAAEIEEEYRRRSSRRGEKCVRRCVRGHGVLPCCW